MSRIALTVFAGALVVAMSTGCGSSNRAGKAQVKRDQDRAALQLQDVMNQRDAMKSELERVRQAAGVTQKELAATRQMLDQAGTNMSHMNGELAALKTTAQQVETQKTEVAVLKRRLAELEASMRARPADATEERTLSSPSTQPAQNLNK